MGRALILALLSARSVGRTNELRTVRVRFFPYEYRRRAISLCSTVDIRISIRSFRTISYDFRGRRLRYVLRETVCGRYKRLRNVFHAKYYCFYVIRPTSGVRMGKGVLRAPTFQLQTGELYNRTFSVVLFNVRSRVKRRLFSTTSSF